ncbi:DUF6090 family protein [Winogradskyella sp. A3E31]|uniref:DUF6090 family protein n=1 Tax=Winogradskyella sp. A3E31 TaxID=3349637 RepID=UPI00398AA71A
MGKYFKYAIGEIILVVIGILIALWINNLNIANQQNKERSILISNLKQELNENLDQFNRRTNHLAITNKNLIEVLNFSASANTKKSLDSLRSYVTDALVFEVAILNNSRLSSAKSSGKFSLLSEDITTALTDYETSITNYIEFINLTNATFQKDWSQLVIKFNSLENFHNMSYPDTDLATHSDFILDDEALAKYLKEPETYKLLHEYYTKYMVEKLWLRELKSTIESALVAIESNSHD